VVICKQKPTVTRSNHTVWCLNDITIKGLYKLQILRSSGQVEFLNGGIRADLGCVAWDSHQVDGDAIVDDPEAETVVGEFFKVNPEYINLAATAARSVVPSDFQLVQTEEPVGAGGVDVQDRHVIQAVSSGAVVLVRSEGELCIRIM